MKLLHSSFPYESTQARQRGVVLFVALIALVVMSLAAVALIRSVDTSVIIAGNLAFKQSATTSAENGLQSAIAWLEANKANSAVLEANNAANANNGYYATNTVLTTAALTTDAPWVGASSAPATGSGIDANGTDAKTGNTALYVIERLCNVVGPSTVGSCLMGAASESTGTRQVLDATQAGGGAGVTLPSPMYRVTTRVTGPKNTVSFIQAFVY